MSFETRLIGRCIERRAAACRRPLLPLRHQPQRLRVDRAALASRREPPLIRPRLRRRAAPSRGVPRSRRGRARDDFAKYRRRVPTQRLDETFRSVAAQTGGRFVCATVSPETKSTAILDALHLLEKAGLVYRCVETAASGLPLENFGRLPDVAILPLYAAHRLPELLADEKSHRP